MKENHAHHYDRITYKFSDTDTPVALKTGRWMWSRGRTWKIQDVCRESTKEEVDKREEGSRMARKMYMKMI